MGFLSAGTLIFAIAGAVPLLIHLLVRYHRRPIKFPAIQFIQASKRLSAARNYLKELLLLALRTAVILLFVFACARPYLKSGSGKPAATGAARVIIVLDNSFSMGCERYGGNRLQEAKRLALRVVDGLAPGSEVAVISTSEGLGSFTVDLNSARASIQRTSLSQRADTCSPSIAQAAEMMRQETPLSKEVYVFTDLTRKAFSHSPPLNIPPGEKIHWCLVDVGLQDPTNLAVTDITTSVKVVPSHTPVVMRASLIGPDGERAPVELYIDGEKRDQREAGFLNGAARCEFTYTFRRPGVHFGKIVVQAEDDLAVDNERGFCVVVEPSANILCIGEPGQTRALLMALSPPGMVGRQRAIASAVRAPDVNQDTLHNVEVAICVDVPAIPRMLQSYAEGGGAIIIFPGNSTPSDSLRDNRLLALPNSISIDSEDPACTLDLDRTPNPLVSALKRNAGEAFAEVKFRKIVTVPADALEKDITVMLTFDNGSPALLERHFGRGHIMFFATGLTIDWNDLPRSPAFVPFIHELVNYARARTPRPPDRDVGEIVSVAVHQPDTQKVTVTQLNTGRTTDVPIDRSSSCAIFRDTDKMGPYLVSISDEEAEKEMGFFVNLNREESDLRRLRDREIAQYLPTLRPRIARGDYELADFERNVRIGKEFGAYLLIALVIIGCMEGFLANRFYRNQPSR